jgi:hAT family C-terminal dimerisation region
MLNFLLTLHREFRKVVLDVDGGEEGFWGLVEFVKAVFEPMYIMLRKTDTRAPVMGKFYKWMSELGGQLDEVFEGDSQFNKDPYLKWKQPISDAHQRRWAYLHSDYHSAGYVLDPNFLGDDVNGINDGEVFAGLQNVVDKLYHDDPGMYNEAMLQCQGFRDQEGIFASTRVQSIAKTMPAHKWWDLVGGEAQALRKVAMRVLSKTTSASACERNWAAFEAVQQPKRTRLGSRRLNDLTYLRVNLRLLQARQDPDYKNVVTEWVKEAAGDADDEAGSGSDSDGDSVVSLADLLDGADDEMDADMAE